MAFLVICPCLQSYIAILSLSTSLFTLSSRSFLALTPKWFCLCSSFFFAVLHDSFLSLFRLSDVYSPFWRINRLSNLERIQTKNCFPHLGTTLTVLLPNLKHRSQPSSTYAQSNTTYRCQYCCQTKLCLWTDISRHLLTASCFMFYCYFVFILYVACAFVICLLKYLLTCLLTSFTDESFYPLLLQP